MMTPVRLLLMLMASLFSIETLIMIAFAVLPHMPVWQEILFDATTLTVLLFPVLYFLVFRPIQTRDIRQELARQKLEQMEGVQRLNRILVSRELRMKELYAENQALKAPIKEQTNKDAEGKADHSPIADADTAEPLTEGQEHDALLFALEDLDRSQHQIKQAHHEWVAAMDALQDPVFMHDKDYRVMRSNRAYAERAGMSVKEVVGKLYWEVFPRLAGPLPHCLTSIQEMEGEEGEVQLASGEVFISRSFLVRDKGGGYLYSLHVMEDITERKRSEQAILRLNRAFRTLTACNHELVHSSDEAQLLQAMCRVIVEEGGYRAAWVGYKQQDVEKTVRSIAQYGFEGGYLDTARITWADNERGRGPTGKAVRSGLPQFAHDIRTDPDYAPWREQALKRGYTSSIALPLLEGSEVFGVLNIYAAEKDAFNHDEVALLEEMAGDLAFGIRMLRLRHEQQRSAEQVRMGLEGTVRAVATMVELRDPYTAGHQQRVAQLAAAIAVAMGLPEMQVRGIHLAGTIHDLGKIQTPAEILSKPGKLNAAEFSLIKYHPQNGYDILKDIEFPWPIAQMVLQHHEKLDGSGYPQGLKGDDILLEAKILTVADVTEAILSHRPYRPSLGLDTALAEISKGRGTHYDPDAVDACVKLFKEDGFAFK